MWLSNFRNSTKSPHEMNRPNYETLLHVEGWSDSTGCLLLKHERQKFRLTHVNNNAVHMTLTKVSGCPSLSAKVPCHVARPISFEIV